VGLVRGLLDRLVLLVGTVAGGCVPGFITQYRQRVGGRLDQVQIDLAPFQEIARRFHGGDLTALVAHHLKSSDPSFHAEGQAIQNMLESLARLKEMMEGLTGSVWQQIWYLARYYDKDIGAATWHDFLPSFNLDPASLMVAVVVGVGCWLLFLALWRGLDTLVYLIVRASVGRRPVR
jgi:hypothetical protein